MIGSCACLETPAFIAGFDDITVMGEPVEERRGHLGVAEDARPFPKVEIGRHDNRSTFIEAAHEMEEELPTSHPEHKHLLEWHDGPFNAEDIEPDAIQAWMNRLANRRQRKK